MNILEDKSLRFHGVGHNILKFISILENGILTKNDSKNTELYTKNYGGYNQDNMVSTTISPSEFGTYTHGAFGTFISEGIGFVLKDCQGIKSSSTLHHSGFDDEEFHIGSIEPSKIVGIIANRELMQKKVTDLDILKGMGTGFIDSTCYTIIKFLQKNGVNEINMEETDDLITQKNNLSNSEIDFWDEQKKEKEFISDLNDIMVKYLNKYFTQLLGKEDISISEIIKFYNERNLPIYDEKGVEILSLKKSINITPAEVVKSALKTTTTYDINKAANIESKLIDPEHINEGEKTDD